MSVRGARARDAGRRPVELQPRLVDRSICVCDVYFVLFVFFSHDTRSLNDMLCFVALFGQCGGRECARAVVRQSLGVRTTVRDRQCLTLERNVNVNFASGE
jgi:hypothetical protein